MMIMVLHAAALLLYATAAGIQVLSLAQGQRLAPRAGDVVLLAAVALHAAGLATFVATYQELPLVGLAPSLSALALLIGLSLLAATILRENRPVGLVLLPIVSGLLLLAMQTLTENCSIKPRSPFSSFYAFCPVKNVPPEYVQIDKLNSLLVAFDMLVLILIVMMLLVQLLGPGLDRLTASARPFNPLIAQVYFLVALVVVAIGFQHASAAWVAGGTTVAMMGLIVKRDP